MAKLRIIGEGTEFLDNWVINSNDVGGVRVNGTCVQRLGKDGTWYDRYNAGKPIEKILWTEDGSIMAVLPDGRVQHANVSLSCNPRNKPQVRDNVVEDKSQATKSATTKIEKYISNSSRSGWWWKWPLKGL